MTYSIRKARLTDGRAIAQIELNAGELFKTVGLDALSGDVTDPAYVKSFIASGGAVVAVNDHDEAVGFALSFFLDGALHLHEMSVDPAHGRKGLGGLLLKAVADWAGVSGYNQTTLSTFKDVPWNAPFYERHGYTPVDVADWTPGFFLLREHEELAGLPIERRCFMKRECARDTQS